MGRAYLLSDLVRRCTDLIAELISVNHFTGNFEEPIKLQILSTRAAILVDCMVPVSNVIFSSKTDFSLR